MGLIGIRSSSSRSGCAGVRDREPPVPARESSSRAAGDASPATIAGAAGDRAGRIAGPGEGSAGRADWLCIHTEPRREEFAAQNLRAAGFHVYLPRYERWIRHARRRVEVTRPLFPRYLFVCPERSTAPVMAAARTPGVARLVGEARGGALVPHAVIAALRGRENDAGLIDLIGCRAGARIRLLDGPFAGFEAVFEELDDRRRALVLVEFLGKAHRIKVAPCQLAPAA